jgi:filamentous hemagglutinin family protein
MKLSSLRFLLIGACTYYMFSAQATAQIVPDSTLPTKSEVTSGCITCNITGGTQAGQNLFHSFDTFSIPANGEAFFSNAIDIQNIITRVTGNSISKIDGLIRANGAANLFLINPSGIVFGENAQLNIGGSFVASTANQFKFGDFGFFSATNPEQPNALLNISPSALVFSQGQAASIQNNSRIESQLTPKTNFNNAGLRVGDGKSLVLVGGNININNGGLNAYSGRVELGAFAVNGEVELDINSQDIRLKPNTLPRANISLTNKSGIDVQGGNAGSIAITARELNISEDSFVIAGIGSLDNLENTQAGNIDLNATDSIVIETLASVANNVRDNAVGNAGNININTINLKLNSGGKILTDTNGRGNGGKLVINARNVSLDGRTSDGSASAIFTRVLSEGKGNAGSITINTDNFLAKGGAGLFSFTLGQGNAGDVKINAPSGSVRFEGRFGDSNPTGIYSNVEEQGVGNGGNIHIIAKELLLLPDANNLGAELFAITKGKGNAGDIIIEASDRVVFNNSGGIETDVRSNVDNKDGTTRQGGDIIIKTNPNGSVSFDNKGLIIARNGGRGNAGNVSIITGKFSAINGSFINAETSGNGNAGSIDINASQSVNFDSRSSVLSSVSPNSVGNAGDIRISTQDFLLNNAALTAGTEGRGNAGNVIINASRSARFSNDAGIFASVGEKANGSGASTSISTNQNGNVYFDNAKVIASLNGEGTAGNINIFTGTLSTANSTFVNSTNGKGAAGTISIDASHGVFLNEESNIVSNVSATGVGNAGDIRITTENFLLSNSALIAGTDGQGNAGQVLINASRSAKFSNDSGIYANVGKESSGNGNNININTSKGGNVYFTNQGRIVAGTDGEGAAGNVNIITDTLSIDKNSFINAPTGGTGDAGTITIDANSSVFLNDKSMISSTVSQNGTGFGGSIRINTGKLSLNNNSDILVNTSAVGQGEAGNIDVTANSITIDNGSALNANTQSLNTNPNKQQATITINSQDLILRRNSNITTNASGQNVIGGNININTDVLGAFENSFITVNSEDFRGGNIRINTQGLFVSPNSSINARGNTPELRGDIEITKTLDPSGDLFQLPENLVDASQKISTTCTPRSPYINSTFTVTGRGSLPQSPFEPLQGSSSLSSQVRLVPSESAQTTVTEKEISTTANNVSTNTPIVEASLLVVDSNGSIELVAPDSRFNSSISWQPNSSCQ